MQFSWDDGKDLKNYEDHGLHLRTAAFVFNDPYRIERPDLSANNTTMENRWQTIGKVDNVIFVVYEERKSLNCFTAVSQILQNVTAIEEK